jgi:hypothetical protein
MEYWSDGVVEEWNTGVLEWWSVGVLDRQTDQKKNKHMVL